MMETTAADSLLVCQSCDNQKLQLERVESKLIKGMSLFLCQTCRHAGYEPRHIVILAYVSENKKAIDFIKQGLYVGKRIELRETL